VKIIYVAGPYRNPSEHMVLKNIMAARDKALFVWRNGGVAICPHLNTFFMGGAFELPDKTWLDGDLEIIRRCDAIWMIPGWEGSGPSKREEEEAKLYGLKRLYSEQQVITYLTEGRMTDA